MSKCTDFASFIHALLCYGRPLVEGAIAQDDMAQQLLTECDILKRLPLGAYVLRCVGRAYRHVGQRYLRKSKTKLKLTAEIKEDMREKFRSLKHIFNAGVASGNLALREQSNRYKAHLRTMGSQLFITDTDVGFVTNAK